MNTAFNPTQGQYASYVSDYMKPKFNYTSVLPEYTRVSPIAVSPTVPEIKSEDIAKQASNNLAQVSFTDKINAGASLLNSVANAYLGYKAVQQAQEQMAFNKEQYYTNLANTRKMVNSQLEDRQAKRIQENIANGKAQGTSVSEYMAKYGV